MGGEGLPKFATNPGIIKGSTDGFDVKVRGGRQGQGRHCEVDV